VPSFAFGLALDLPKASVPKIQAGFLVSGCANKLNFDADAKSNRERRLLSCDEGKINPVVQAILQHAPYI